MVTHEIPGISEDPPAPAEKANRTSSRKRILQGLSSFAVVVIFLYALPQFADFSRVWEVMRAMTWIEVTTLALVALWNIATYWFVMVASLPGSNYWQAMNVNQTSTASPTRFPVGGAIGIGVTYAMYSAYGFSRSEVGRSAPRRTTNQTRPDAFATLSMPAMLLLGSESPGGPRQGTDVVHSLLPDSRIVVLEGQGHVATMAAPELFAGEVVRYLTDA